MRKVFFIVNCFSKGGGAESLLASILNSLNPKKYKLGVMEIIHDTIKKESIPDYIKVFPYYTLADAPDRKNRMYYVYHEWNNVIDGYIPKDYDVYISFNYLKPSFLLPQGKKNIAWIHGDVYNLSESTMREERELQDKAFEKVNRIVVISDNTEKSVLDLFPNHKDKVFKLYNCIDSYRIQKKAEERCDIVLEPNSVIVVGRLDNNKNPLRAVKIFAEVLKKNVDTKMYFLGYGNLQNEVEAEIKKRGIENNVFFLGYFDNPFPIIKQAKVMLMVSKSEGYSLAISEAISLGVPVISTKVGAAEHQINCDINGRVIETDIEAVDAICEYLNRDYDEMVKKEMFESEKDGFTNYIKSIEKLIDSL